MPGIFNLRSIAVPTNLGGSLAAGGNLAASTTYYYKVFAFQKEYGGYGLTISPRSDTFSIATDATNKTVNLTWTAPGGFTPVGDGRSGGYVVLRNTVDSFPDESNICIMRTGETHHWNYLNTTSFTDDGTKTMGQTARFIGGLPTICITGGTDNDPVTMWDIYQWALTNLPGRVKPACDTNYMDFESNGWKKNGISWIVHANLYFGWNGSSTASTYFKFLYLGALIVYGGIDSTSVANLTWGSIVNSGKDADFSNSPLVIVHRPAIVNMLWAGVTKAYGLRLQQGGRNWGSLAFSGWNHTYSMPTLNCQSGSALLDCGFAQVGNGLDFISSVSGITFTRCRFPGVRAHPNVSLVKPHITQSEGLGFRHYDGCTVTEPTVTFSSQDIIWKTQYTQIVVDGVFESHNQADNRPWLYLGFILGTGGSLTFKQTVQGNVSDRDGNAISGAQVTLKDATGATVFSDTTDANGNFNAGAVISRILEPASALIGVYSVAPAHEDTHVSNGYLSRTMKTPHTLTIEKAGYVKYQDVINLTSKLNLKVSLSLPSSSEYIPVPSGQFTITANSKANLDVILNSPAIEVDLNE